MSNLRDEAVGLLQQLLRLNTVNPPGNETIAAHALRDYLASHGVECELYARTPERANLVARLPGGDGPSLAFMSHTDTVVADAADWSRDPWSGDLADEHVWGRGALDMKNQAAAGAVAFASLAREGFRPAGDLVFIAAADEEVGKAFGLEWLCEEHPETVRVDYAVNEGGGERVELGGSTYYLCASAEKMSAPFRLRVHGRSGHASMPGIADNALVRAAPLIEALGAYRPEPEVGPEVEAFLTTVLGETPRAEQVLARLGELDPLAVELIEPLLSLTLSPTVISASEQRNVIPATCDVTVDCRLLAGKTPEDVEPIIREVLGEGDYELEFLERSGGTRSSLETPLWRAIEDWVGATEPGAKVAPVCCAGFTDSHWLRDAFGTVAYGFFPMRTMDPELAARLIHSADERVHVDDLELGVEFLRELARSFA
ncbi:MAG: M20/M25/M40 family metallo-hydrolase [Gaiellaceae bacterium MAG52_C11]|nr:M20/M25/M40 family metallo-hydrolase [Candidatus Gaiellasilicea maunaloa]